MVIDANVALKWVFSHPDSPAAMALAGRRDLQAPSSFKLEIAHALTRGVRQRILSLDQMREGFEIVEGASIAISSFERLLGEAVELSLRLHATTHDCVYLALAIAEDDILITADARFMRAASRDPAFAKRVKLLSEAG